MSARSSGTAGPCSILHIGPPQPIARKQGHGLLVPSQEAVGFHAPADLGSDLTPLIRLRQDTHAGPPMFHSCLRDCRQDPAAISSWPAPMPRDASGRTISAYAKSISGIDLPAMRRG